MRPPNYLLIEPFAYMAYWTSPCPLVFTALEFPGCFSVLHIETGSLVGVVRRLQGANKGVREKLTVYFLSLALGNCTTSLLHIFSVLSDFYRHVFTRDDHIYSQSNRTFAFHMEDLLLVLSVF